MQGKGPLSNKNIKLTGLLMRLLVYAIQHVWTTRTKPLVRADMPSYLLMRACYLQRTYNL